MPSPFTPATIPGSSGGGTQLAYQEAVNDVSVTATLETAPTDVLSSGAVTYDGSRVCVEYYACRVIVGATAGSWTILNLWNDATDLGRLAILSLVNEAGPVYVRRYLTPSAGSHTLKVVGWRVNSNGTVTMGAGGVGTVLPSYIRVTTAPA